MTDELIHKLEAARRLIQLAAEQAEKEGGRLEAEKRLEEVPPPEYADDVRRLSGEKVPTLFDV